MLIKNNTKYSTDIRTLLKQRKRQYRMIFEGQYCPIKQSFYIDLQYCQIQYCQIQYHTFDDIVNIHISNIVKINIDLQYCKNNIALPY